MEPEFGTNPYRFGMIGSTDAHTALQAIEEDNFFSESGERRALTETHGTPVCQNRPGGVRRVPVGGIRTDCGLGLKTKTPKCSIWEAMNRKEVSTAQPDRESGVRFFGGWNFSDEAIPTASCRRLPYTRRAFPWVGRITGGENVPTFMVYALRDPTGANLDRIRIVKGWLDADGATHEKVYDVAWSGQS